MSTVSATSNVQPACTSYAWLHVKKPPRDVAHIARVTTRNNVVLWPRDGDEPNEEPPYCLIFQRLRDEGLL